MLRIVEQIAPSGRVFSEDERYFRWLYYYSGDIKLEEDRRLHAEYRNRQYEDQFEWNQKNNLN